MKDRTRRAVKQAAVILLLIGTLSVKILPPQAVQFPRAFLMDAVALPAAPLYFTCAQVAQTLDLGLGAGPSRLELENEVKRLTADLVKKESELTRAKQTIASFRDFTAVARRSPFFVWSGDLLGYVRGGDADVYSRSYIISVGTRDGVENGLPVVWGNIALGRISEVGALYSRVRVLTDPQSRVCVRFARSRHEGVLIGSGRQMCPVRYVPNKVEEGEIREGDVVVTSGTDGVFPPELVVGTVTQFIRRPGEPEASVEAELFLDFSRVENCLVLKRAGAPSAN